MNRLKHLKETLPKNIEDNLKYPNVEFIVLNYNSSDEIDEWIASNMSKYLNNGILKYIKTEDPTHFLMSHSKNVVAKQASGEIICSVDADNFIGKNFAEYVNSVFLKNKNMFLAVNKKNTPRDCYGRICFLRKDFFKIKGYDESMIGYGFEDDDFRSRLQLLGRKVSYISNPKFLESISHNDSTRLENEKNRVTNIDIYVQYINHYSALILYLFKNNDYSIGYLVHNRGSNSRSIDNLFKENRNFEFKYRLFKDLWMKGKWHKNSKGIVLKTKTNKYFSLIDNDSRCFLKNEADKFREVYKVHEQIKIDKLIMFFSQINNRIKMKQNKADGLIAVNSNDFGSAKLIE